VNTKNGHVYANKKHENGHGHINPDEHGWILLVIYPTTVNPNIFPSSQINHYKTFINDHKSSAMYIYICIYVYIYVYVYIYTYDLWKVTRGFITSDYLYIEQL
jgi:hypothetical protein